MSKLTKEQLDARRKRMQEEALSRVVKTEQLNIRMDEYSIMQLYSRAEKEGKPVGALVREWIAEKLDTQKQSRIDDQLEKILFHVESMDSRIQKLENSFSKKK